MFDIKGLEYRCLGDGNKVTISDNCKFARSKVLIEGNGNTVDICESLQYQDLVINLKGNDKNIRIGPTQKNISGLKIVSIRGKNQVCHIGNNFSCGGLEIQMNDGDEQCKIGDDCLFSWGIKIRTSDGHSVIDLESEEPINFPQDVEIKDRVWIGEDVRILKGTIIENDCVIGSGSILTKPFKQSNCVLVGSPARVVRDNIKWDYKPPAALSKKVQIAAPYTDAFDGNQFLRENSLFYLNNKGMIVDRAPFLIDDRLVVKNQSFSNRYTFPDIYVSRIRGGKLVGDEFYCTNKELTLRSKELLYLTSEKAVERKLEVSKIIKGEPSCVYISGANSGYKNFYHWIFQALPTIALCKNIFHNQHYKIVVPPLNGFRCRSLELLGIDESNLHVLEDDEILEADELIYCNLLSGAFSFNPAPFLISLLDGFLMSCIENTSLKELPQKIFVSRKDSPRRALENEVEVSNALQESGYKEVVMSEYSLEDQVAIFYHAEKIVAPHGAALVNLMFAKTCKQLLEIIPSNYSNDCFFRLSQVMDIDYANIIATSEEGEHYHHTRSVIDLVDLAAVLTKIEVNSQN
jgi:acetyltransferase-like isoleucine patch superfamily enzyme